MKYLVLYLSTLSIIFLILYIFMFLIKDKKNKLGNDQAYYYITQKYKLNMTKERVRLLCKIIVVDNSIIISIPIFMALVINLKQVYLLIIAFFLFVLLIIGTYNLIGKMLKKKGW